MLQEKWQDAGGNIELLLVRTAQRGKVTMHWIVQLL